MEIKAILDKPYEERDKMNFIILNNYNLGYEIRETQTALEAWGYTEEEQAERDKQAKIAEINSKIEELEKESVHDVLYGNKENVKVYQDVINGLIATREGI